MYFPRSRVFWAVSLGHMSNDIFMAMGSVLLAFIDRAYFPITAASIGFAIGMQQFLGGVSQPFFGWLSDRGGSRWYGAIGVAWTVTMLMISMGLVYTGQYWLMVIPFILAALGSAAFHPVGTAFSSSYEAEDKAATSTAYFFMFGQLGLAIGPALAGFILGWTQRDGGTGNIAPIFFLSLVAIPGIVLMATTIPRKKDSRASSQVVNMIKRDVYLRPLILLALLIALRGLAYPGSVALIPELFKRKGWDPASYGAITSSFWIASAFSGVLFGMLADRIGRRAVVVGSMILAIPVYLTLPLINNGFAFVLAIFAGVLTGGTHSIIMVMAQSLIPGRKAFASGVGLGYIFGMGAVGSFVLGLTSDGFNIRGFAFAGFGLESAFQMVAGFLFLAAVLGLFLPAQKPRADVLISQPEAVIGDTGNS